MSATDCVIQAALSLWGFVGATETFVAAAQTGIEWLTLAWTANGDTEQIQKASRAFTQMLVSIAMTALALAGSANNATKALEHADNLHLNMPQMGLQPAMAGGGEARIAAHAPEPVGNTGDLSSQMSRAQPNNSNYLTEFPMKTLARESCFNDIREDRSRTSSMGMGKPTRLIHTVPRRRGALL